MKKTNGRNNIDHETWVNHFRTLLNENLDIIEEHFEKQMNEYQPNIDDSFDMHESNYEMNCDMKQEEIVK